MESDFLVQTHHKQRQVESKNTLICTDALFEQQKPCSIWAGEASRCSGNRNKSCTCSFGRNGFDSSVQKINTDHEQNSPCIIFPWNKLLPAFRHDHAAEWAGLQVKFERKC